jgi:hypothetical protein
MCGVCNLWEEEEEEEEEEGWVLLLVRFLFFRVLGIPEILAEFLQCRSLSVC